MKNLRIHRMHGQGLILTCPKGEELPATVRVGSTTYVLEKLLNELFADSGEVGGHYTNPLTLVWLEEPTRGAYAPRRNPGFFTALKKTPKVSPLETYEVDDLTMTYQPDRAHPNIPPAVLVDLWRLLETLRQGGGERFMTEEELLRRQPDVEEDEGEGKA